MRKVRKTAKKRPKISVRSKIDTDWDIETKNFCDSCRTVSLDPLWKFELRVVMLRLRKSSLKAKKYVKMDFEQEFEFWSGQFFCSVCRTISRIMCKKNFTKIFTKFFSRIFQSQKLERHRNMNFCLSKHHPFEVFSSSFESQDRVLEE